MVRARLPQLSFAAVALEHAHRGHGIVSRANHVVASIADYYRLCWVDARGLQA
jgi:hypothetical protein